MAVTASRSVDVEQWVGRRSIQTTRARPPTAFLTAVRSVKSASSTVTPRRAQCSGELLDRAVVSIERRYQAIARVKQLQYRHVSREPRGKGSRPDATLEGRDARFERSAVGCAFAAVAIARADSRHPRRARRWS